MPTFVSVSLLWVGVAFWGEEATGHYPKVASPDWLQRETALNIYMLTLGVEFGGHRNVERTQPVEQHLWKEKPVDITGQWSFCRPEGRVKGFNVFGGMWY